MLYNAAVLIQARVRRLLVRDISMSRATQLNQLVPSHMLFHRRPYAFCPVSVGVFEHGTRIALFVRVAVATAHARTQARIRCAKEWGLKSTSELPGATKKKAASRRGNYSSDDY